MKKTILAALMLLSMQSSLFSRNFLLEYPKGGSHWMMLGVEFLLERPWFAERDLEKDDFKNLYNPFGLKFKNDEGIFYFSHDTTRFSPMRQEGDKLFLMVRNPKEQIIRMHPPFTTAFTPQNISHYLSYLREFEKWPEKDRLIVYYEDILNSPKEAWGSVLDLMGESKERLDHFSENIDHYHAISYAAYQNWPGQKNKAAKSNGKKSVYHSQSFSKDQHELVEKLLLSEDEALTRKYLSRYLDHN